MAIDTTLHNSTTRNASTMRDTSTNSFPKRPEEPKRRKSLIEMAREEVETTQHVSLPSNRENYANYANQFLGRLKNFANKVYSKNQKDSDQEAKLSKYEMTDFMVHNPELYQEFKDLLIKDHIVTQMAVNEELNIFLVEKVEKIMFEKKIARWSSSANKAPSPLPSDSTDECSFDEDDNLCRCRLRNLRRLSLSCDDTIPKHATARQRRLSLDQPDYKCTCERRQESFANTVVFEKMRKRTSMLNNPDSIAIIDDWDDNNTITYTSNTRITRSLSEDSPSVDSLPKRGLKAFRDDSFLNKLTAANHIPCKKIPAVNNVTAANHIPCKKIPVVNNVESNLYTTWNGFDESDRGVDKPDSDYDCVPSSAFQKMKRRLSES